VTIPRVIHTLWLGDQPIPEIFDFYAESWRRHHPAWEMRLWREDALPPLVCQAAYEREPRFKVRYDIVRLEILRNFGGVIVDMDVEPIRPLDPLLEGVSAFAGRTGRAKIGNQVLGAVPHHPFFARAIERLRGSGRTGNASAMAGKRFLSELLAEYPEGLTVFPAETFYFQPALEPTRRPGDFPDVYAVHHELTSYSSPLTRAAVEHLTAAFAGEVSRVQTAIREGTLPLADVEPQLTRAADLLLRSLAKHEKGCQAQFRRLNAERAQAEARLREAERRLAALPGS
jgi:hypothetical protein